jgi:hypothetical protein
MIGIHVDEAPWTNAAVMTKNTLNSEALPLATDRDPRASLLKAARAVLRHRTFPEAARVIFDEACHMTGAQSGYVALMSADGSENELLFLEAGGLPCSVDPDLPMPIRGLRADSYAANRAVWDNDFMNSRWASFLPTGHVLLRNVLFAPLVIEGRAEGIIGLANKPGDFTEDDAVLASAFADFAAVALQNSRMVDDLRTANDALRRTLSEVKTLRGILPICAHCKKIRDEDGYWQQVDEYIHDHADVDFSHGICRECAKRLYGYDDIE